MGTTLSEIVWLRSLVIELGVSQIRPLSLICDNQAALQISSNLVFHKRTKHIETDCHYIRETIQDGVVKTEHVRTEEQLADLFTKALASHQHEVLKKKLGVKNAFEASACSD